MDTTACELKVVVQIRSTQHDAIEPIVVLKPSNLHEAKPLAVHTDRAVEGADRSSDSELGWHDPEVGERSNFHAHRRAPTGLCKAQRSRARGLPPILLTPGSLSQLFKRRWRHVVQ